MKNYLCYAADLDHKNQTDSSNFYLKRDLYHYIDCSDYYYSEKFDFHEQKAHTLAFSVEIQLKRVKIF